MTESLKLTGKRVKSLSYFLAQKWKFSIFIIGLSFTVAFFEMLATVAIYPVLAVIMPQQGNASEISNRFLDYLMTWMTQQRSLSPILVSVLVLFVLTLIKLLLGYSNTLIVWLAGNQLHRDTQIKMMSSILAANYQFMIASRQGDLTYRILYAPGYVCKIINAIPRIIVEILKTLMILVVLLWISTSATIILIGIAMGYFLATREIANSISYGTGSGRAQSASNQATGVMNVLKGFKFIRLFGVRRYWLESFKNDVKMFYLYARKDEIIRGIPAMLLELVCIGFVCSIIVFMSVSGMSVVENIPVIGLFAFSMLCNRITPVVVSSLRQLGNMGMELMANLPHAEAAYIAISESERNTEINGAGVELESFNSAIEFDNVTFFYDNTNQPALADVNLLIRRGQFIGIIGPSGSGKTTLIDLAAGLLHPCSGRVLLDGKPIKTFSKKSLSRHIGYVGQDPFLINDSIRNNILFGRQGTDDCIVEALEKAGLKNFVESLPKGLDYIVADDGMKLSGGQRQRISIARALLYNPEILLLDEATSALDLKTETKIINTILDIIKQQTKTVIFVTHRKSAIEFVDQVIEMQDGRILRSIETIQANENPTIFAYKES